MSAWRRRMWRPAIRQRQVMHSQQLSPPGLWADTTTRKAIMDTYSEDQADIDRLETDGVMFFPPAERSCRRCGFSHQAQSAGCPRWPATESYPEAA